MSILIDINRHTILALRIVKADRKAMKKAARKERGIPCSSSSLTDSEKFPLP